MRRKRAVSANLLLQQLFTKPVITVYQTHTFPGLSSKARNDVIDNFVHPSVLREMTGQSRNCVFVFDEYLDKFKIESVENDRADLN